VEHSGIDRADLARVHVEPLSEQVAPHVDAGPALEQCEPEHDLRFKNTAGFQD
jgi:hypothetical protein